MKTGILFSGLALLVLTAFTGQYLNSYQISEDYTIKFDGRGASGTFSGLQGDIIFDANQLEAARINVKVDASTISTGNKTKDKHARGESWFDVENYPEISFRSQSFNKTAEGYSVAGTLKMHGTEKSVTIPFNFTDNVFTGKFSVNREEYGIEGPFFGFTVAVDFAIELRVPVQK